MLKKILIGMTMISSLSMASEGVNLYFRTGADINGKFTALSYSEEEKLNDKKAKNIGYEIASEVTKEVLPNFELGLGLAYQNHSQAKEGKKEYLYNSKTSQYGSGDHYKLYFDTPEVTSIPVYLTSKYTFTTNSMIKPYIKADLGYSFNNLERDNIRHYTYENGNSKEDGKYKAEIKDGVYFGIGGGIEYYNFTMDLMYKINKAELSYGVGNKETTKDFDYSRITFSIGYKFDF